MAGLGARMMDSRPRLHGDRLSVGIDEGMGPRIREDKGGGRAVREPPLREIEILRGGPPRLHEGRLSAGITEGEGGCAIV